MTEIHYFPRYSQRENTITNNTLLLMMRLYDHSRFKFEKFLRTLFESDDLGFTTGTFGLQFHQQQRAPGSVPDGWIAQDSIKIVVETKRSEGEFAEDQLVAHLDTFSSQDAWTKHKMLVMLAPTAGSHAQAVKDSVTEIAHKQGINVECVTFRRVCSSARECLADHDEQMQALVEDYAVYCSHEQLLPKEHVIFVPPCGQSHWANREFRLYYCPASRSIRQAKYLGMYWDKAVRRIGEISKVVACDINLAEGTVSPLENEPELTPEERVRILGAAQEAEDRWGIQQGFKFYLCDRLVESSYRKRTPGGIQGHRYFDLEELLKDGVPDSLEETAAALATLEW